MNKEEIILGFMKDENYTPMKAKEIAILLGVPKKEYNEFTQTLRNLEENYKIVKSPMVGTFYASPAPDKPPFVSVGDKVHKGQVLCVIEAMKLMNEIEAESDGTVAEILVENEQLVEFGQPLIRLV